jgi:tetratricopeptide (TPR) repeat protein
VAVHLEEVHGETSDEHAAVLAHHWERAGDPVRALDYTLKAAPRAAALYARPEAIQHYWRALDLFAQMPVTRDSRRRFLGTVLALVSIAGWARTEAERDRGLGLVAEAQRAANEVDDVDAAARLEALLGIVSTDESRLERAQAQAVGVTARAAVASAYLSFLGYLGRYDDALVHVRQAIDLYGAAGARFEQALQVNYGGRCWAARAGRLAESLEYASKFRAIADELDDVSLRALRSMAAEPYIYAGRWHDAARVAEESLPIAFEIAEYNAIMYSSAWLGFAYLKLGRADETREVVERALRWGETRIAIRPYAISYAIGVLALAHLARGALDDATVCARRAIELAEQSRFILEAGAAHRALGEILAARGERQAADASFRRSLEILNGIQSLPELGQTLLAYGRFRLVNGDAGGRTDVERARSIFEEIGADGWAAEAAAALATLG